MRGPIATAPSRISALRRVRDSAVRAASTRSSRSPASLAATTTCSPQFARPMDCRAAMTSPDPDDEKPLDPEQQKIVAKVRWLMLISGFATVLGIAVVIGVIGYRVFRSEGSVAPAEVTAMLPKGAKIVSTAVADGRIAVTIEMGGVRSRSAPSI